MKQIEKRSLITYADNEGPDQTAHTAQSNQGFCHPLAESMDNVKDMVDQRRPSADPSDA